MIRYLLAGLLVATPLSAQDAFIGDFAMVENRDPVTDMRKDFMLTYSANHPERNMTIFCIGGSVMLAHGLDSPFFGNVNRKVRFWYRVDDNPASDMIRADVMPGDGEMVLVSPDDSREIMEEALPGRRIILRSRDADGETKTDTFSLIGLTEGLERIGCGL